MPFKNLIDYLEGGICWASSCASSLPSRARWLSSRLNRRRNLCSQKSRDSAIVSPTADPYGDSAACCTVKNNLVGSSTSCPSVEADYHKYNPSQAAHSTPTCRCISATSLLRRILQVPLPIGRRFDHWRSRMDGLILDKVDLPVCVPGQTCPTLRCDHASEDSRDFRPAGDKRLKKLAKGIQGGIETGW